MKSSLQTLVCVSSMALLAAHPKVAHAIITINCTQNISFGVILPNCNGSITVQATPGSGTVNNGCHSLVGGVIRPGICNVVTTAMATATSNARVTFTVGSVAFSNTTGGGLITIDNYRLETGAGSVVGSFTYNSTLLNPTHSFRVGGRLQFDNGETNGTYNTNLNVCVTAIP